jgi:hypothetical protein
MRKCPNCGFHDNPLWEYSRFEFNAEFMRFSEALNQPELEIVCLALADAPNHEPLVFDGLVYYRRGTNGIELYRQEIHDFQVSRERKRHKIAEATQQ